MSITNKAVSAGIQSATSKAKDQAMGHYTKEIDGTPVSKMTKNALHAGMHGVTAAATVALAEVMIKAFENIHKSKPADKAKPASGEGSSEEAKSETKAEAFVVKQMEKIFAPALMGLAVGASIPFVAASLEK